MNEHIKTATTKYQWKGSMIKKWIFVFIPLIIIIGLVLWLVYSANNGALNESIAVREGQIVELQKQTITRDFQAIVSDLMIIADSEKIREMLDGDEGSKEGVGNEFSTFSERKRFYDQVRYLDDKGMEVVRVNFNEGKPALVPEKKLQSKGNRYYFKDAFVLGKGEVFISPLDLNVEGGKIERPAKERGRPGDPAFETIWRLSKNEKYVKPMIRFATPIFDGQRQKRGIVLVNYFGAHLIGMVDKVARNSLGKTFLINGEGFWLKGSSPEVEWGFMRGHDSEQTCGNTFPLAWKTISSKESGQFHSAAGLFTFTTVYPLREGLTTSIISGDGLEDIHKRLEANKYRWKVVSYVPKQVFADEARSMVLGFYSLFIILAILSAVGSLIWAHISVKNKKAEEREKQLMLEATEAEKNKAEEFRTLNQKLVLNDQQLKDSKLVLERKVKELKMMNNNMVDRELRIIEMKEQVNKLSVELGRPKEFNV